MTPAVPVTVIFGASTKAYQHAYAYLSELHGSELVRFVSEAEDGGGFRKSLLNTVGDTSSSTLFFLVDDIVFTEDVQLPLLAGLALEGLVPSMRMGRNLTFSYTVQRRQPLPPMKQIRHVGAMDSNANSAASTLWAWRWRSGTLDWAYPLSVDGNLFVTEEIRRYILHAQFTAPNNLENALQAHVASFLPRWGVCYDKSRLVNIPMNRVQNAIPNLHGDIHQDDLLDCWMRGLRLDIRALNGFRNTSAHENVPVSFIEKTS